VIALPAHLGGIAAPPQAESRARLSRPAATHFLGPCDAEQAVPMPQRMKEDLNAVAHVVGKTGAELSREVLSDYLYGRKAQVQRIVSR
jgi:hypothetical protein